MEPGETQGRDLIEVLILEDWEPDAVLMERALAKDGFQVHSVLVQDRAEYERLLAERNFDVILADYRLRGFTGMEALALAQNRCPTVPFIMVTGSINEETAVECMKAGAWDYVIKSHLLRLGPAVRAALRRRDSILEQQRAQEELDRNRRRFQTLIEHATDIIVLLDAQGRIAYASPSVERVLGYRPEGILGRSIREFVHAEDSERLKRNYARVIATPRKPFRGLYRFVSAEGDIKLLEVTVQNLLDSPDVSGVVVNARDVTQRKLIEDRFLQAQKLEALGQLAGGVAHDFNNVLTAVLGNVELLLMRFVPGSEEHQIAVAIKQAAEAGARVSRQLTTFARGSVARPEAVDLREVVRRLTETLRPVLGEDVDVSLEVDELPALARVDVGQMEQAVLNLAVNAREAMPEGGRLHFRVHRTRQDGGRVVVVEVQDAGRGIPEEVRDRIFEPFFTTKANGTGLGLYTVRSIVEGHGGTVQVDSKAGQGTTVRLVLPALPLGSKTRDTVRSTDRFQELPRGDETVLVVEDEPAVLKFTLRALTTLGYNVVWARDGEEALAKLAMGGREIALLLTDVVLPGLRSNELVHRLLEVNPRAKVVYMSGYTREHLERELEEGAEFLQKPFTMAELAGKIRRVLDSVGT